MSSFAEAFKELRPRQRDAVLHIQGPLLVLAGPGTGKTQLLSMRVAQILKQTDTDAATILCLTFTNKAAANMRKRLQSLVGSDSLQVNVKTFHSLAAELMGEYPEYFWNGARLVTAPDAVQTDIIDSILSTLPLDNPLAVRFAGKYTAAKDVKNALKLAKEAGLTPDKLRAIIEANLAFIDVIEPKLIQILDKPLSYKRLDELAAQVATLPEQPIDNAIAPLASLSTIINESLAEAIAADESTNKTEQTGKWKRRFVQNEAKVKGMHRERRANQWWLCLADVYVRYRDELHRRGCYDYADMLIEVIGQLEQQPAMLADVQERYQYILVDEFQDSNAAQMRLAHLISSNPAAEGKPNLMAVGDDDQSIYKFQGAELNNMLGFRRTYKTADLIVLEENFRSSQTVLDTARDVIELAADRLVKREKDISKNIVAVKEPEVPGTIRHDSYPSKEHQYYDVARDIRQRRQDQPGQSIAVLAGQHESLRAVAAELHRLEVPVQYEQQRNILEHEAVAQLTGLCEIVQGIVGGDETAVNAHIAGVLGHQLWDIDPLKLWHLAVDNRFNPHWLDSLLKHSDKKISSFGHWLVWLAAQARAVPMPVLFDYMIGLRESESFVSPFKEYFIAERPAESAYIEALSAVQRLRGVVGEFGVGRQASLADFVAFIRLHQENDLIITDESIFVSAPDAVQLLSVHKAKGLEFDIVYILDATESHWRPRRRGRGGPANLPLRPYGDDMDDYVRLMYVALTRARHSIFVSSYRFDGAGEDIVASPLIANLPLNNIETGGPAETAATLETAVRWPELATRDAHMVLAPILEDFSLNVTGLINFLDVIRGGPAYFRERNLLRLPAARTIPLAFGDAIHSALELAQRQVNSGDFNLGSIKMHFETRLKAEPILPDELERWIPHGTALLDKLFDQQLIVLPEQGMPEQKLQGVDIGGALLGGKLDHVIQDGNEILISDYKTGAPLTSLFSKAKGQQIKIWKHKTQLIFYALLAGQHPLYRGQNITCRMLYLEAAEATGLSRAYRPSKEEIDRLGAVARAVYQKIIAYDLPDTSAYKPDITGILQFEQDLLDGKV